MEGEIYRTFKVWLTVFMSLSYCYAIKKTTQKGPIRLFCVIPVVGVFLQIPLNLHSIHTCGITSFFISWLANFKLLLFAFGRGPLCIDSSMSLARFLAFASLPIKIQQCPPPKPKQQITNGRNKESPSHNGQNKESKSHNGQNKELPAAKDPKKSHKSPLNYGIKLLLLVLMLRVFDHRDYIHPKALLVLYCSHLYLFLDIILAVFRAVARAMLGLELEPQFDEPYLSSSLQDFWGRRWNLMVTSILRPTVYEPVLVLSTSVIGRKRAPVAAIMATFTVSALMHELIFYYLGRVRPTWEITWFFVLHGVSVIVEIALKKEVVAGKWRLPRLVSTLLTLGFVMATASWLFFPPLLRCKGDVRAFEEYAVVGAFVKNIVGHSFDI